MDTTQKSNGLVELSTDNGYVLHRIGSEDYPPIRRIMTTTPGDWEEVAVNDIPPYTKTEYDAKAAELVRKKYSADEEFALQRKMINATQPCPAALSEDAAAKAAREYAEYNAYVEQCKAEARRPELYRKDTIDPTTRK